jgi:hypothetical protein
VWFYALKVILVLYVPGSPFMIMNMVGNRKSAFKKRNAPPPPEPNGLVWPVTDHKSGERGSTETNKAIWRASLAAVDPAGAEKLQKVRNWRFGYVKQVEANVRASLASGEAALAVAKAGLAEAHRLFEFARPGKTTISLKDAMDTYTDAAFETVTIKGNGKKTGAIDLAIPYGGKMGAPYHDFKDQRNDLIKGDALRKQLEAWATAGVIEPDCAAALAAVADHPEWLDLSNHYFVLLGAGSAMGPLPLLLSLGANVYAVDIDRPNVWKNLIGKARAASGSFSFPVRASKAAGKNLNKMSDDELADVAGANLLQDTPEIATWLTSVCPQQRVTVGNYTYLDGALHVQVHMRSGVFKTRKERLLFLRYYFFSLFRSLFSVPKRSSRIPRILWNNRRSVLGLFNQLSLACDAIIGKLAEQRPDLALAFLCTPTDCHVIPKEAHDAAKKNLKV